MTKKSSKFSTSGIVKVGRLRGSSITSIRGTPAIVRTSIDKVKEAIKVGKVTANFSFSAENDDELDFNTDDEIEITKNESLEWYEGRLNGKIGIFPKSYVSDIY